MIYKFLNAVFGWDYIAWRNTVGSGIARVHVGHDGVLFYWRYKSTKVYDRIREKDQVIWLTCEPNKYISDKEN